MGELNFFEKLSVGKKIAEENEIVRYYRDIRKNKHIFIYSVGGRTSSTALQRILNSSNEVCIFGEPHYIPDKILDLIEHMKTRENMKEEQFVNLKKCFQKGKHDLWYANAIKDLDSSVELLASVFSDMLRPINGADRFGYKEIRIFSIKTLEGLLELFPNSYILFIFKNPLRQWPSVKNYMRTAVSNNLDFFLREYKRMSDIYLKFAETNKTYFFVEDFRLYDLQDVKNLLKFLKISRFDETLLDLKIRSAADDLDEGENEIILSSPAYSNFLKLSNISRDFFLSLK